MLEHGLTGLSLRPLATAIGSSPRVLLFLFESKEGLVRALLERARADELALIESIGAEPGGGDLAMVGRDLWGWLAAESHRGLLRLWVEAYAHSLIDDAGPWSDFARGTVADWLELLGRAQPRRRRSSARGSAERTLVLAVLRGALLDLLATGELERTTAAVELGLRNLGAAAQL